MKKALKITAISLASLIGVVLLAVIGYVIYISCQYYRIDDNAVIDTENLQSDNVNLGDEYSISTYNIGFGAYSQDFSFFMDTGEMADGTKTVGKSSVAKSRDEVVKNTVGAIDVLKETKSDFMFIQEVDTDSTRSHGYNQYEKLKSELGGYSAAFASNFHSAFLMYPIFEPHGVANAGIVTMSKFEVLENVRRQFPLDEGFPAKFFDLDRCFMVSRLKIEGSEKQLVLINLHMSAYDKGGVIRAKQLELLNSVMAEEYAKGNYVIVGGDFNHVLTDESVKFESKQKMPEWIAKIDSEDITKGYRLSVASNAPTCRGSDIPYEKGVNYSTVIDGFIISDNVEIVSVHNVDADFKYSDHNPVMLKFILK